MLPAHGAVAGPEGPARVQYRDEIAAMLRIAGPLALAELGWMAMGVVDIMMVGRLPNSALAIGATSVGSALFYPFAIFGIGLMAGMDTLVSHAFGRGDMPEGRRSMVSAVGLACMISPLLMALVFACMPLLRVLGVAGDVRVQAAEFVRVLVWSLPLLVLYTVFRRYLQGLHSVRPVTIALVTSNAVNALGNWVLIYGHWGAPAMGIRGSALSTVLARIYLTGVLLYAVRRRDPHAFAGFRVSVAHVRRLLRLGLPAATTTILEVGVFNTVTALAGTLDAISLAAHTIALNMAAVSFMVPLGISSAAAVSVGRARGAGDPSMAARAGWIAMGIGAAYELGAALAFVLFPRQITRLYTVDERVVKFAVLLFVIAAVFQVFDGLQTVATGALRGLGDTHTAMLFNLVCYWVIGLPLGCWLCYRLRWGIVGLWYGLCLALIMIAAALVLAWRRKTAGASG
jgi:MATE family multidrug resistance protein